MRFSSMPSIGGKWIFSGITQYKTKEIGLIGYFVYVLGDLKFCLFMLYQSGGVWIFSGITQYKTNEISLIRYFVYVLGGFNFACLCYTSRGGGWIFSGITQYKTNEIGLIRYFVYVFRGFNFACLCYAIPISSVTHSEQIWYTVNSLYMDLLCLKRTEHTKCDSFKALRVIVGK